MNQNRTHYHQSFPSAAATEHVKALINAFLNATTTREQEAELYSFFRAHGPGTLDPSLERYRGMFAWYGQLEALSAAGRSAVRNRSFVRWVAGIAAGVAVLLTVGVTATIMNTVHRDPAVEHSKLTRDLASPPVGRTVLRDTTPSASGDTLVLLSPSESSFRK